MILAMTGKGGVGKTTLSALTLSWLTANGQSPILAVDADSNANLNEALGIGYDATVGGIRESARKEAAALKGVSKQEFLDLRVQSALVEQKGYDLIVMGRPEGQGCYCFANNVLREVLDKLARNYKNIVIDSEAGLEHISRRTLLTVDYLVIVSDCTVRGVRTAGRISALADEVALPAKQRGLIVNRVPGGILPEAIADAVKATGLPLLAAIPLDQDVAALDADGVPVSTIPPDAPARLAMNELLDTLYAAKEEKH
ncbi:MAG TPA: AAA family ATPase [Terriglobales bacterium]|jgi:CO dehydrogenase maturation factor|nr:AAA family ATPase [Terriglobales bacterium]